MRIAVWHNLPSGGGKRALYDHVSGLVKRGHHVELWCPPTADQKFLPLSDIITEHITPMDWPSDRSRSKKWDIIYDYRLKKRQLQAMYLHCMQCAQEINTAGFDILISHPCTYFATSPIGELVNIPSILYLAEPKRSLYEANPLLPWQAIERDGFKRLSPSWIRKYLKNMFFVQGLREQLQQERTNAKAYDLILVNSFFSRESVLRAYGLDSRVCYLGVDADRFVVRHMEKEHALLSVGSFTRSKNVEFVIRALAKIPNPRPKLIWVGNVVDKNYLQSLIELADLSGVQFLPKILISDDELIDLYNSSKLLVYSPRLEPFGLAPLEANACGLPVVGVAEGGVRETVINGKNGFLVENSEQAMADAIQKLLDDPELAATISKTSREWVEESWTMEAAIDRLLDFINEVTPGN